MITRNDLDNAVNTLQLSRLNNHSKITNGFNCEQDVTRTHTSYSSETFKNVNEKIGIISAKHESTFENRKDRLFHPYSQETFLNSSMDHMYNEFMSDNKLPRSIEDDIYQKDLTVETKQLCRKSQKRNSDDETITPRAIDNCPIKELHPFVNEYSPKYYFDRNKLCHESYDTSSIIFNNDDVMTLGVVNFNDILKPSKVMTDYSDIYALSSSNTDYSSMDPESPDDFCSSNNYEQLFDQSDVNKFYDPETSTEDKRTSKISTMQRSALDSIFTIVDRPSRGLVLHIGDELCLHHITVKNFFSNGRRRLRRAAARLNDPERTKRENQRRKEKRRLAALAAAASKDRYPVANFKTNVGCHSSNQKEQFALSPQRKALMEKLTVKIQKSVAQKAMAPILKEENDSIRPENTSKSQDVLSSCKLFPISEHSNHNETFHLFDISQNEVCNENRANKMYQEYAESEQPLDFYASNLNQGNYYMDKFVTEEQEKCFPTTLVANNSPTNWYSLIYS